MSRGFTEEKYVEEFFKRVYTGIPVYIYQVDVEYMSRKFNWNNFQKQQVMDRLNKMYQDYRELLMAS